MAVDDERDNSAGTELVEYGIDGRLVITSA